MSTVRILKCGCIKVPIEVITPLISDYVETSRRFCKQTGRVEFSAADADVVVVSVDLVGDGLRSASVSICQKLEYLVVNRLHPFGTLAHLSDDTVTESVLTTVGDVNKTVLGIYMESLEISKSTAGIDLTVWPVDVFVTKVLRGPVNRRVFAENASPVLWHGLALGLRKQVRRPCANPPQVRKSVPTENRPTKSQPVRPPSTPLTASRTATRTTSGSPRQPRKPTLTKSATTRASCATFSARSKRTRTRWRHSMTPETYQRTERAVYNVAQTHLGEFDGRVDLYPDRDEVMR